MKQSSVKDSGQRECLVCGVRYNVRVKHRCSKEKKDNIIWVGSGQIDLAWYSKNIRADERKRIAQKVRKMKWRWAYLFPKIKSYNQALDDVLQVIADGK